MTLKKHIVIVRLWMIALLLTACAPEIAPTAVPVDRAPLLISEIRTGAPEFVELYNATTIPLDLQGYQLVYREAVQPGDMLLYAWRESALIPPHGHYLLVKAGREDTLDVLADAVFTQPLDGAGGGLSLVASGQVVDTVEWGPAALTPGDGSSLERRPGGDQGNGVDTAPGDRYAVADFFANPNPNPQNTGSPPTPIEAECFSIALSAPDSVEPGERFGYGLSVTNQTGAASNNVEIVFPLPPGLTVASTSGGGAVSQERGAEIVRWRLAEIAAGEVISCRVTVTAPLAYATLTARGYYVQAGGRMAMGGPVRTRVAGGVLPISAARALDGEQVTVEGGVTFAARTEDSGVEFYLQDESGGVQVRVWDEIPAIAVGDVARAAGEVRAYHGSARIAPARVTALGRGDARAGQWIASQAISIPPDPSAVGRLVAVTGQAIRLEAFAYGYEIDLLDSGTGDTTLVYLAEPGALETGQVEVGRQYTIVGVGEVYNGVFHVKARAGDIAEVFPPVLALAGDAPAVVLPGAAYGYTFTVSNHTAAALTDLVITATLPLERVAVVSIADGGVFAGDTARWAISELPSHESRSVHVSVTALTTGVVSVEQYVVQAAEWPLPEAGPPLLTYAGASVPIPVIQGAGFVSPYNQQFVTTEGIVTGVFPDLGGLWVQNTRPDGDPATSEGLFIATNGYPVEAQVGDLISAHGQVRERAGQTELHITTADGISIIKKKNSRTPPPEPVELDPPAGRGTSAAYYEPLEGMLVSVTEAAAVAPTGERGECALARARHGVGRIWGGAAEQVGLVIRAAACGPVYTGDRVGNVRGPLAADWDGYKIEPLSPPDVAPGPRNFLRPLSPTAPGSLRVAALNLAGAPQGEQLAAGIARVVADMGAPAVIGFQGVERIEVLEEAAARPELLKYGYRAVTPAQVHCRAGGVGLLARGDQAMALEVQTYPSEAFDCPPLRVTLAALSGDVELHVIVSRFSAEVSSERLAGPGRTLAAEWIARLVDGLLAADPQACVLVLGDWGEYEDVAPALTAGDIPGGRLVDVTEALPLDQWYSTISEGGVAALPDRILATPALAARLVSVDALRVNADYPPTAPGRCADHDPLAATFAWED